MTMFTVRYPEIGRCMCGAVLHVDSFRNDESHRAFFTTGLCQRCSDDSSFVASKCEPGRRFDLWRGALVANRREGDGDPELGILPFLFLVEELRIAWEARFIVRMGSNLEPLDTFDELLPMKDYLAGHQIRVHEGSALDADSGPGKHLANLVLLIALDRTGLEVAEGSGVLPLGVSGVSLADSISWRREYGRPLLPVGRWWPFDVGPPSVLRICALMGFVLCLRAPDGRGASPFQRVVADCGDSFAKPFTC